MSSRPIMRKLLEAIAALALAVLFWITWVALYGPGKLTGQIPTHFGPTGQPTAYGPPSMLLLFPIIGIVLYALMTAVSFFPSSFNYPVRVTAQNRPRLQQLALNLIAFLKAETLVLFAVIQQQTIQAVRQQTNGLPVLLMPAALVLIFLTIGAHLVAMRRSA